MALTVINTARIVSIYTQARGKNVAKTKKKKSAEKKPTEHQKLLARYVKKYKKNPPVGTSTEDLRKIFKTKKTKSSTSREPASGCFNWKNAFWS